MADIDYRTVGGVLFVRDGGDRNNPDDVIWNFGVMGRPGIQGPCVADNAPNLYDVAPHIQGAWDGKSSVCCHDAARKVLGKPMPPQHQPRGTCGGRTGKMAGQLMQCVLIAAGRVATYHPVSHAWLYYLARREYGMLGSGDGVPDGSIPPVMAKYGLLHAEEAGDTRDYGDGSDDLAARWGGRSGAPREMFDLAEDNKVSATLVKVRSLQELCDGYAAGGVGLVSSMRGFAMTRDADGYCAARGSWAHYMTGSGFTVANDSRDIYEKVRPVKDQSWGRNTPSGPQVEEGRWPDFSFATDGRVVERDMIRNGSFHLIFGFELWDESKVINWRDI